MNRRSSSTSYVRIAGPSKPDLHVRTCGSSPSTTRTNGNDRTAVGDRTSESKIRARSGCFRDCPAGGGTRWTIASRIIVDRRHPFFADAELASSSALEADQVLRFRPDHGCSRLGVLGMIDLVDDRDDLEVRCRRPGRRWPPSEPRCPARHPRAAARPRTRLEAACDLVGEVDVAGGVDQVQLILVEPVLGNCTGGEPRWSLIVMPRSRSRSMRVQDLFLGIRRFARQPRSLLQQTICQRGFAVVDVGHDAEVARSLALSLSVVHWRNVGLLRLRVRAGGSAAESGRNEIDGCLEIFDLKYKA